MSKEILILNNLSLRYLEVPTKITTLLIGIIHFISFYFIFRKDLNNDPILKSSGKNLMTACLNVNTCRKILLSSRKYDS